MILQYCPIKYRNKAYGCGFGPIHPTAAFLDYWGKCPKCGAKFRPYRKSMMSMIIDSTEKECQVTDINGQRYCKANTTKGEYCKRHEYVQFSVDNQLEMFNDKGKI